MSTPSAPLVDPRLIAQLSGDFASISAQMRHVGENLAVLQAQLSSPPRVAPVQQPIPAPVPVQMPAPMYRPPVQMTAPRYQPPQTPPHPFVTREPWWQRDGVISRVLAVAGVGVTLIGVVMLLVLAAQAGIFGPPLRVAAGAAFSAGLVFAGIRVFGRPGGRVGGIALAATGIAGAYLDVMAVAVIYHWLMPLTAMVVALGVAATGVALAVKWESQPLALLVVVGVAGLAPVLTGGITLTLIGFLFVVQVASFPAQLRRNWLYLGIARTAPVVVALLIAIAEAGITSENGSFLIGGLLVSSALVALTGVASSILLLNKNSRDFTATAMIAVSTLPLMTVGGLYERAGTTLVAVAFAAAMLTVAVAVRWLPPHARIVVTVVGALALLQAALVGASTDARPVVLLGVAAVFLAVAGQVGSKLAYIVGAAFAAIGSVVYLVTTTLDDLVDPGEALGSLGFGTVLASAVLVTTMVLLVWNAHALKVVDVGVAPILWLCAGLAVLYAITAAFVATGSVLWGSEAGFIAGHCAATIVWMLAATGALVFGLARRDHAHAALGAGLALTCAALVKLFLFDLAMLDGLFRVSAFLVVGLLLLGAGTRYAREFAEREPATAATAGSGER